jgi:hypothetical protein
MKTPSLKEALKGDSFYLVWLTELIQSGEIDPKLIEAIKKANPSNPYSRYLCACLNLFQKGEEPFSVLRQIELLDDPLGFFLNLKAVIYTNQMQQLIHQRLLFHLDWQQRLNSLKDWVFFERKESFDQALQLTLLKTELTNFEDDFQKNSEQLKVQIEDCLQDKRKFSNPLLIFNEITREYNLEKLLQYSPLIYSRLSPGYKTQLYDLIKGSFFNEKEAKVCYLYARCFEKMKLYTEMSQAFHRAEKLDNKGIYQRKLVKTLEKIINSNNSLFKCKLDYNYLKNSLEVFLKDLINLNELSASYKVSETEKINSLKEDFLKLSVKFDNFTYIYQEKSSFFSPKEHQVLVKKFNEIVELFSGMLPSKESVLEHPPASLLPKNN